MQHLAGMRCVVTVHSMHAFRNPKPALGRRMPNCKWLTACSYLFDSVSVSKGVWLTKKLLPVHDSVMAELAPCQCGDAVYEDQLDAMINHTGL